MLQKGPAAVCSASAQEGTAPWGIRAQQGKRWLYLRLVVPIVWTAATLSDTSWGRHGEALPARPSLWRRRTMMLFCSHVRLDSCHFPWSSKLELFGSSLGVWGRHSHQDPRQAQCSSSNSNAEEPSHPQAEWRKVHTSNSLPFLTLAVTSKSSLLKVRLRSLCHSKGCDSIDIPRCICSCILAWTYCFRR